MPTGKLTGKQKKFIELYLASPKLNATQAYIDAGYARKGAEVSASQLLRNTKVAVLIQKAMAARSKRTQIKADTVLIELAKIARASVGDYLSKNKENFDIANATEEQLACLESLQLDTVWTGKGEDAEEIRKVKVTLPSKLRAWELIGKHVDVQAFQDNLNITSDDKLIEKLNKGRERARAIKDG